MASEIPPLSFHPAGAFPPHYLSLPNPVLRLLNYDSKTGLCKKGWNDFLVVAIFTAAFFIARKYAESSILPGLAKRFKVGKGRMLKLKFLEQSWLLFCHTILCTTGVILLIGRDYAPGLWGNHEGQKNLWRGYPHAHRDLEPMFKLYYFAVLGYWLHLCVSLALEGYDRVIYERGRSRGQRKLAAAPKRSDFGAMCVHHFVTVSLVALSHYMNFTHLGHVVMILLDISDILLPLAKILKYTGHQLVCDVAFAIFTVSWIVTRHGFLLLLNVSMYRDSLKYLPDESRFWDPWGKECFYSMKVYWMFLGLFAALQILLLYWLAMILKVVIKVIRGGTAEDVRSDDEEDEEEEQETRLETRDSKPIVTSMPKSTLLDAAPDAGPTVVKRLVRPSGNGVDLRSGDWDVVKESQYRRRR
ncbi:TLC domain-containing protein [Phlyctochytrium arcticum]|nr:TLC domain-containing protein [Phlyctochytrium arcticum]